MSKPTAEERFLAKIKVLDSGCWEWQAYRSRTGYGRFKPASYTQVDAYRWAYEHWVGPVPTGLELDHLCRNRACVNPQHLEAVTHRVNVLRGRGMAAKNAAKTHCIHGHEFTPENTYIAPHGGRQCRKCIAAATRRYKARKAGRTA